MVDFSHVKVLLLDGLTSQCLEYTKAFNAFGCDTTVLCNDRFDTAYASREPKKKILGISNADDLNGTESWILKLIRSNEYDIVIPFTDYSAAILSKHKEELSKFAHIIVNDKSVFEYAQNKLNVMDFCAKNDIPCPMTLTNVYTANDIIRSGIVFPIVIKPQYGYGAHGFRVVATKNELIKLMNENCIDLSKMVVQEYIPENSLNVAGNLFIDRDGIVKSSFLYACYRIYPIKGGSGILNVTIDRKDIHETCAKLATKLSLKGPIGIDLIIDSRDNVAKVLEVNLRPIACAKVGFLAGVNPVKQILEDISGKVVTPMFEYALDVRVRRSQLDWIWFLKSADRFRVKPSWFDRNNTTDQLFSWTDPAPWFAFWIYGIKKTIKDRKK